MRFDLDSDGVCDNQDDCVGVYDECGICNGRALQNWLLKTSPFCTTAFTSQG